MQVTSTRPVVVEPGGEQVAAHVGLHSLGRFADAMAVGDALSGAIPTNGRLLLHDRGKVVLQTMLMLAGGGEACTDIEHLRAQPELFCSVPSDSTVYRTFTEDLTPDVVDQLQAGMAEVRAKVWRKAGLTRGSAPVVLDIDSTLAEIHSENKEDTAPTYKGGFGFHPMLCFADATGEALSGLLRPGNAGANDATDHLTVLDAAIAALPAEIAAGHHEDDDGTDVARQVVVRADSAGATSEFVWGCYDRAVRFSVTARTNTQVTRAISAIANDPSAWRKARRQNGKVRKGAGVADVTAYVDLSAWPPETRLIIRREPLHPGAQQTLLPNLEYRYVGFYTDQSGRPVALDAFHRAHAHVEDNIAWLKDSGLERYPFTSFAANSAWMAVVGMAGALVRWFQRLCLTGLLARAEPKALRWRLWHAPARLVRSGRSHIVRILDGWPDAEAILGANRRIARLT
jgi:Transposase DDE domain group 1